jgi:Oxidoreductase molybdopterin binding domain
MRMRGLMQTGAVLAVAGLALGMGFAQADSSAPRPTADAMPGQMSDMHHGSRAAAPAGPLKITFGDQAAEWTPEKLAALPHTTIKLYNEHAKADQTFAGVPLIELLKPLGLPEKPKGKDFALYLVAEGSDGYTVVYSMGEVTPDVHDGTVLVADAMDGKPLGANGPVQLVASGEKRPARWVRNLVAIRVKTAE